MRAPPIIWEEPGEELAADPGATLALSGDAWEAVGARFTSVDDGQGETPRLAKASVSTAGRRVTIGILDYGESSTYLLVPGPHVERAETTTAVLQALADSDLIRLSDDVIDTVSVAALGISFEERIVELERQLEEIGSDVDVTVDHEAPPEDDHVEQKVRIRLGADDHSNIEAAAKAIVESAMSTGATVPGSLANERSVYFAIRSPFKHEHSRKHFEIRTHKRLIEIIGPVGPPAYTFEGPGIFIEIEISDVSSTFEGKRHYRSPPRDGMI